MIRASRRSTSECALSACIGGVLLAPLVAACSLVTSFEGLTSDHADGAVFSADAGDLDARSRSSDALESDAVDLADGTAAAEIGLVSGQQAGTTLESGQRISAAFPAPLQTGTTVVVAFFFFPAASVGTPKLSDTLGNVFTSVVGPEAGPSGIFHYIAVASNISAGADTVTLELTTANSYLGLLVHEYAGLATNPFDVGASASGTARGSVGSGAKASTSAHELVFGLCRTTGSASPGSGFTERVFLTGHITEDRVVSSAGRYEATAVQDGNDWSMLMATFKGR